ncbi:parathyroid hormone 4-like [Pipra filicauda]|uniref:Parathyroid hormone 4-like n=1 Tax=Pipra filicauda TaxID=649802 RepID=A0A6J2HBT6_9PASS|nr:parathyroid hormone 4-like [Pipra filicauda]XP_027584688.1 parathyroid hormone 4-like [Pipra filicauda]XP_027584689.1 parathyroid hormone 4-like [Pipra filicauda]XP_039235600.1 parathyroid hormone 4-like [Pipra filicauda]
MFLPQRSLQTVTFLAILFFACFAMCQEIENRRAVTEHQLMHDKGRAFQGLKRLLWLHNALGTVHTASSRDIPPPNATWDVQKSQNPSDLHNSIDGDETSSLMKQLLELREAQGFLPLKQLDLKSPKGNWNPQGLFELLQTKELGSKRNPSTQPQDYSR